MSDHTAIGAYLYFLGKIFDMVETMLFVLRKKFKQVSLLHVYHHVAILLGSYASLLIMPGGHSTMLGILNTFVHVIMYTYYFVTIYDRDGVQRKKYDSFKIRLTQLQLVIFFLNLIRLIILNVFFFISRRFNL